MIKLVKEDSRREMYYVGKTKRFRRRMEEHVEGRGATWIKKNFTQAEREDCVTTKIREVDQNINADETEMTLKLMIEHGVNFVRGAEYCYPDDYDSNEMEHIVWACNHHLLAVDLNQVRRGLKQGMPTTSKSRTDPARTPSTTPTTPTFRFGAAGGSAAGPSSSSVPVSLFGSSTSPRRDQAAGGAAGLSNGFGFQVQSPTQLSKNVPSSDSDRPRAFGFCIPRADGFCIKCHIPIPMDWRNPLCKEHDNDGIEWALYADISCCHACGERASLPLGKLHFSRDFPVCHPCWKKPDCQNM